MVDPAKVVRIAVVASLIGDGIELTVVVLVVDSTEVVEAAMLSLGSTEIVNITTVGSLISTTELIGVTVVVSLEDIRALVEALFILSTASTYR